MKLIIQIFTIISIFIAIACELDEPELKSQKKCIIPSRILAKEDTTLYGKFDLQLDGTTADISKINWKSTGPDGNIYTSTEKAPSFTYKKPGTYATTADITTICGETSSIQNSQILRTCAFPDSISTQYDATTFGKIKLTFKGDTKDIVNVKWVTKNEKGSIVDSVSTKERSRETTLIYSGKYITKATITTKCGDIKTIQSNLGIRTCVPPNKLLGVSDDKIWGAFNINFEGNILDISTIQWTTYNAQNTPIGTGNSKPNYEIKLNTAGEYRTTAKITTICNDDIPPFEIKFNLKPCELPVQINAVTSSWGEYSFNFSGDISDITQVIWTTTDYLGMPINTTTKTEKGNLLYTYKIIKAGDYKTVATIKTRCGDSKILEVKYTLKACELPTGLTSVQDSWGKFNFYLLGVSSDIKSITWITKNASGTEINRSERSGDDKFAYEFTTSTVGNYKTCTEIITFCGDKIKRETSFELKACSINGDFEIKYEPTSNYEGAHGYYLLNVNFNDIQKIIWLTKNKTNGSIVENKEINSEFNKTHFIIPGSGTFIVTCTIITKCGETKNLGTKEYTYVNCNANGNIQITKLVPQGSQVYWGTYAYQLTNANLDNITSITWNTKNKASSNLVENKELTSDLGSNHYVILPKAGTYIVKCTIKTYCGKIIEIYNEFTLDCDPLRETSSGGLIISDYDGGGFPVYLFDFFGDGNKKDIKNTIIDWENDFEGKINKGTQTFFGYNNGNLKIDYFGTKKFKVTYVSWCGENYVFNRTYPF